MSRVTITGWDQVQQRVLQKLHSYGEGAMTRALGKVGDAIVEQYRENIARGRSPAHKFPKLSEPYATRKARRWGNQPLLVASGSMRDSLAYRVVVLGPGRFCLEA